MKHVMRKEAFLNMMDEAVSWDEQLTIIEPCCPKGHLGTSANRTRENASDVFTDGGCAAAEAADPPFRAVMLLSLLLIGQGYIKHERSLDNGKD